MVAMKKKATPAARFQSPAGRTDVRQRRKSPRIDGHGQGESSTRQRSTIYLHV